MKTTPNTSIKRKTIPFIKTLTPRKKLENALKECEKIENQMCQKMMKDTKKHYTVMFR